MQILTPSASPHATTHSDSPTRTHLPTALTGRGWKHPKEKEPWVICPTAARFSPSLSQLDTMWYGHALRCCTWHTVTHPACLKRSHWQLITAPIRTIWSCSFFFFFFYYNKLKAVQSLVCCKMQGWQMMDRYRREDDSHKLKFISIWKGQHFCW